MHFLYYHFLDKTTKKMLLVGLEIKNGLTLREERPENLALEVVKITDQALKEERMANLALEVVKIIDPALKEERMANLALKVVKIANLGKVLIHRVVEEKVLKVERRGKTTRGIQTILIFQTFTERR